MYIFQSTSTVTGSGLTLANGDTLVVAPNVNVVGTESVGVSANGNAKIQVYGLVAGPDFGISSSASSGFFDLFIAPTGMVTAVNSSSTNLSSTENHLIRNYGSIQGLTSTYGPGQIINYGDMARVLVGGSSSTYESEFYNYGTLGAGNHQPGFSNVYSGSIAHETIYNFGTISGDMNTAGDARLYNFGDITGDLAVIGTFTNEGTVVGAITFSGNSALNSGSIFGNVTVAATSFDSSQGYVYGSIQVNGGYTVAALNGGIVKGGGGNDVLVANQTHMSADLHSTTTMSGKGGVNALYGGGAFNVFMAGDSNGGYNQIWGGASQMTGVDGYTNNTLSFENAVGGVYVDILNGHNAYVAATGSNWTGTGTYEDSIINVPNIVGSNFADVIQADNGIDRITGGGRADQLYAGSGAGSQDTFVFKGYSDSNVITGYDTIVGFKIGIDKIDLSAFSTDGSHLAISTAGTSNTVYLEKVPGVFNASTDLAMIVNTSAPGGLHFSDFIL